LLSLILQDEGVPIDTLVSRERGKTSKGLNIDYNGSAPRAARVLVHLRRIDHEAALVAPRPAHEPLPQHAVDAVKDDLRGVDPRPAGDEVAEQASAGPGEEMLVGELHVVEIGRLLAVGAVYVSEDVQAGADAPDFAQEVRAAEVNVAMVFLSKPCQHLAAPLPLNSKDMGGLTGGPWVTSMSVCSGTLLSQGWDSGLYWNLRHNCQRLPKPRRTAIAACLPSSRLVGGVSRKVLGATLKNVGRPKNGNAPALDLLHRQLALEIHQAVQIEGGTRAHILVGARLRVKEAVVVSRYDDLDAVRLGLEPVELFLDGGGGAVVGQVAGVDEDVARGDADDLVVGVGDADDADWRAAARRVEGRAAQEEREVVEARDEVRQRRREQVVEQRRAVEALAAAEAEPGEDAHGERRRRRLRSPGTGRLMRLAIRVVGARGVRPSPWRVFESGRRGGFPVLRRAQSTVVGLAAEAVGGWRESSVQQLLSCDGSSCDVIAAGVPLCRCQLSHRRPLAEVVAAGRFSRRAQMDGQAVDCRALVFAHLPTMQLLRSCHE